MEKRSFHSTTANNEFYSKNFSVQVFEKQSQSLATRSVIDQQKAAWYNEQETEQINQEMLMSMRLTGPSQAESGGKETPSAGVNQIHK
ncbi:hypothetical protein SAMN05192553_10772 [Cyclobacterium xiamenense]|uniref:Uncharacterized protein n=1 Tax=Cyclobacterium xiamenense TaxID=1297121 RepID=A0A1H7AHX3_9BACT|nr:hypothetical protein [Cyclobacterium xiamenense]SEJ65189.1 hypothetical protein SAMN05192553_10772 [Cyclobacterium xiamenense]